MSSAVPSDPADLGVAEASALLDRGELSSVELVDACLARIEERDGVHSHDGDPGSVNAWVRVYADDARAAAARADARRARGGAHPLCGVPVGLKDLYAAAGKPLTASSRLLDETPAESCEAWARLEAAGMVLLGHLHTHEFAVGGTTDQVGNPWALDRSPGGSSGGSAAALAARMVPAATGTDTAGSLRIPSALCGTSAIKPTRGTVSMAGIVPLGPTLDHAGPMARTVEDCAVLLAALAGPEDGRPWTARASFPDSVAARRSTRPLDGARLALSPRVPLVELEPDVAAGLGRALAACRELGAAIVDPPAPEAALDVATDFLDVIGAELVAYHRRFDGRRELYRPSLRQWVEQGESRALPAGEYVAIQARRRALTAAWARWWRAERVTALVEPTVPVTAPPRGDGYEVAGSDVALISLTHYWNWTGFPVVALPSGTGPATGLPVGVSLVGPAGSDPELVAAAQALQDALGVPAPPGT
jgi:aspartyl-tRNA(Asn)/glutamyl-tRNA(Gln) amidotransferase subunit A